MTSELTPSNCYDLKVSRITTTSGTTEPEARRKLVLEITFLTRQANSRPNKGASVQEPGVYTFARKSKGSLDLW